MSKDPNSPFNWRLRTEPSIFAKDVNFRPRKDGKSVGERQSELVAEARAKGVELGTLYNLGKSSKEKEQRMLAYKQFGVYSRATPSIKHPNKHEE